MFRVDVCWQCFLSVGLGDSGHFGCRAYEGLGPSHHDEIQASRCNSRSGLQAKRVEGPGTARVQVINCINCFTSHFTCSLHCVAQVPRYTNP